MERRAKANEQRARVSFEKALIEAAKDYIKEASMRLE